MTQSNYNTTIQNNGQDQTNFIDVVIQLWRGKWLIAAFVAIAIVLTGIYLVFAKEEWTSTAIITQPDAAQIASYSNALNIVYGGAAPSLDETQHRAISRFNAAFSALAEMLDNQEVPEKLIIWATVKGQPFPLSVSYVGESPEAAQKQLAEFIQRIDTQIAKELEVDLKDNIKQQILTLNDSLLNQEKVAEEQKALRIQQIREALKFSEAAKITTPQVQQTQDVTQDTMFLLGSEALNSMIEHESTRPLVFPGAYYQTKQKVLDIKNLKVDPSTIHVYRYVMKPNLPVRRDSPKRTIIMILAILLGGTIGSGVVLGRNALRNYKPKM